VRSRNDDCSRNDDFNIADRKTYPWQSHGVEVDMMLQVAADLNRAVDYEAIANAFGEHRDVVRRLRTELEALGFAIDQRGTSPGQQRSVQVS
jgi:hypothetical protein